MPLPESVIAAAVGRLLDIVRDLRRDSAALKVRVEDSAIRECFSEHLASLSRWAESLQLLTLVREKSLDRCFVEVDILPGALAGLQRPGSLGQPISMQSLAEGAEHCAILGRPGAGKTTTIQKLAMLLLERRERTGSGMPLLVLLRQLRKNDSLICVVLARLGIVVSARTPEAQRECERRTVQAVLDRLGATLLLDGLDEVPRDSRRIIEEEIQALTLAPGEHRLIVSCRSAEWHVAIKRMQALTILPLSSSQVELFADRWLGEVEAPRFLQSLRATPYAGAGVLPLTLAHLAAIYERDKALPTRPIDVYEMIVSLLVEQWDRQRGVVRNSRYADFMWRKKERFLQALAFGLAMRGLRGSFSHRDAVEVFASIAGEFGLEADDASGAIEEVERHTGLFYTSGHLKFDWVHLTIQEFLTAMHAYRSPTGIERLTPRFPNEVALLVAYSSDRTASLESVINAYLKNPPRAQNAFVSPFVFRLVAENPSLNSTPITGWILLVLLSLFARESEIEARTVFGEARALWDTREARDSVSTALTLSRVKWDSERYVIVPRNREKVSLELISTRAANPLLTLDFSWPPAVGLIRELLQTANGSTTQASGHE